MLVFENVKVFLTATDTELNVEFVSRWNANIFFIISSKIENDCEKSKLSQDGKQGLIPSISAKFIKEIFIEELCKVKRSITSIMLSPIFVASL